MKIEIQKKENGNGINRSQNFLLIYNDSCILFFMLAF